MRSAGHELSDMYCTVSRGSPDPSGRVGAGCWGGETAFAGVVEVRRGTPDEAETLAARWRVEEAMRLIDTGSKRREFGGSPSQVFAYEAQKRPLLMSLINAAVRLKSEHELVVVILHLTGAPGRKEARSEDLNGV